MRTVAALRCASRQESSRRRQAVERLLGELQTPAQEHKMTDIPALAHSVTALIEASAEQTFAFLADPLQGGQLGARVHAGAARG